MNDTPAISIIIPMYNAAPYIKECVDSILCQSFTSFEVILVDDGSTDGTLPLVRELYRDCGNIRLLPLQRNMGVSIARNQGMSASSGKYITFIDADDFILPDYLAMLHATAEEQQADVVCMGYTNYILQDNHTYRPGDVMFPPHSPGMLVPDRKQRIRGMCEKDFIANDWGKLYRRQFLLEHALHFEPIRGEDVLFHFPVLYYAEKYILLHECLYAYRQSPHSITRGKDATKIPLAVRSVIEALRLSEDYLQAMPDIAGDSDLAQQVRQFFCDIYVESFLRKSAYGLTFPEFRAQAMPALEKYFHEQSFLVSYLLEKTIRRLVEKK